MSKKIVITLGYNHYAFPEYMLDEVVRFLQNVEEVTERGWGSDAVYTPVETPSTPHLKFVGRDRFVTKEDHEQQQQEKEEARKHKEMLSELEDLRRFKADSLIQKVDDALQDAAED
jgi:hypothetical protein